MSGVTFIGNLIVDNIKIIDKYPSEGNLCNILGVSKSTGGLAANTSIDLKVLDPDIDVRVLGAVGNDENGEYVLKTLSSYNIDITGIKVDKTLPTSFTDVMASQENGARTFFQAQGATAIYGYNDIPFDRINADIVHMGYALLLKSMDKKDEEYGTVMARTLAKLKSLGIKTSFDVVSDSGNRFAEVVPPSIKYADYVFMNEVEASSLTGIPVRDYNNKILHDQVERNCKAIVDYGVGELCIIHSPEGGWAMTASGEFFFHPSIVLPEGYIKGTVGAGDAFCAGMLYGLLRGKSTEECLHIASLAAACSLSEVNSIDGMRHINEVMKLEKHLHKK